MDASERESVSIPSFTNWVCLFVSFATSEGILRMSVSFEWDTHTYTHTQFIAIEWLDWWIECVCVCVLIFMCTSMKRVNNAVHLLVHSISASHSLSFFHTHNLTSYNSICHTSTPCWHCNVLAHCLLPSCLSSSDTTANCPLCHFAKCHRQVTHTKGEAISIPLSLSLSLDRFIYSLSW